MVYVVTVQTMTEHATTRQALLLGARIKRAREDANLTVAQVARSLDVDVRTVTRWQADQAKPSYDRLVAFASLTQKPPSYFIEDEEVVSA